jgi:hypothetical protein
MLQEDLISRNDGKEIMEKLLERLDGIMPKITEEPDEK